MPANRLARGRGPIALVLSVARKIAPVSLVRLVNRLKPTRALRPRILGANSREFGSPRYRSDLLNLVAQEIEARSYLEIGVHRGLTFERILVSQKTGVEPFPEFDVTRLPPRAEIFVGSSNDFFSLFSNRHFDLIFIDGLHELRQVAVDLANAISCLSEGGIIAIDDTWPRDEVGALPSHSLSTERRKATGSDATEWWGDVWKAILALGDLETGLDWCTVTHGIYGEELHGVTLIWLRHKFPRISVDQFLVSSTADFADHFSGDMGAPTFLNPITLPELNLRLASRIRT